MCHMLWNFNENVVVLQLVLVTTKELLVEWKSAALLAINLEVSHLLAGFIELLGVFDADHSRTEWSCQVSLDLWLGIKDNSGLVLEDKRDHGAGDFVLGKVVKVDQLLWVHHG